MGPLWPRLPEAKNNRFYPEKVNDVMPLLNAATGEKMKDVPLGRIVRVSRRKMRALCKGGLDVRYGKEVVGITYEKGGKGVTLNFADGEVATGMMVVGADGPHSKIRELLLGVEAAKATPLPAAMFRAHVCYHDAEKIRYILDSMHPIFSVGCHPDGIVLFNTISDVPDEDKPDDWVLQVTCSCWTMEIRGRV
jgi:L-2-hydroxyglutarate oxidase LhgO